jgi:hypothetical protein
MRQKAQRRQDAAERTVNDIRRQTRKRFRLKRSTDCAGQASGRGVAIWLALAAPIVNGTPREPCRL